MTTTGPGKKLNRMLLPLKLDTLILCMHDTRPEGPTGSAGEAEYWFNFNEFVPFIDTLSHSAAAAGIAVEVTSDDGFMSDYTHLYPWAIERKTSLRCFIPTNFVDTPGRVTKAQLREMHANGVSIGSHGAAHLNWPQTPAHERLQDIEHGKKQLEDMLGAAVHVVAPPFGAINRATHGDLRANGFDHFYLASGGLASGKHWLQERISLQNNEDVIAQIKALGSRQPRLKDTMRHCYRELKAQLLH